MNAGGYWGGTGNGKGGNYGGGVAGGTPGRGAYTSAVNSEGTLQSLTQSIGDNANENPDVSTDNNGEDGYNTNYDGKTGDDETIKPLETIEKVTETVAVSYDVTKESVVAAQKLANRLAGTTSKILDGGKLVEGASRKLAFAAVAMETYEVITTGELKASNVVSGIVTGVSIAFPVAGIAYFGIDLLVEGFTGASIGEHIDAAWGEPIYDF